MNDQSDLQLLRAYAEQRDETAFREIVTRHTDLVYSAALRQVESSAAARDIAQGVFFDLARKSGALSGGGNTSTQASLAGWLHRATRYAALNHLRDVRRRLNNERQAMEQLLANSECPVDWEQIRPLLDEALDSLDDEDREALLLRYFKNQDFRAVGLALGVSDDAAQKRVTRAVERLRELFSQRNVTIGASGLAAVIAANAVQAAPAGLALTICTATLAGTAVSTSTIIAATKTIAMTTLQKTVITAVLAAAAGTGIFEARQAAQLREQNQALQQQQVPLAAQIQQLQRERDAVTNRLAGLLASSVSLKADPHEADLLKLRGEVGQLRQQLQSLPSFRADLLKQKLAQMPDKKIPELKFLTENDWINAAWNADLDTDDGVRLALSKLRDEAVDTFLNLTRSALKKYLAAHDDILPADLMALKSFYDTPVTDEMLQRYQFMQTGKISSNRSDSVVKKAVYADEDYDSNQEMSLAGGGGGSFNQIRNAIYDAVSAFAIANNSQIPSDPTQLTPYLKRMVADDAMQKYFGTITADLASNAPPPSVSAWLVPALKAYQAANNGQPPKRPSDLLPFVSAPEQQSELQKMDKEVPVQK